MKNEELGCDSGVRLKMTVRSLDSVGCEWREQGKPATHSPLCPRFISTKSWNAFLYKYLRCTFASSISFIIERPKTKRRDKLRTSWADSVCWEREARELPEEFTARQFTIWERGCWWCQLVLSLWNAFYFHRNAVITHCM